jgi:hypothetical protein
LRNFSLSVSIIIAFAPAISSLPVRAAITAILVAVPFVITNVFITVFI